MTKTLIVAASESTGRRIEGKLQGTAAPDVVETRVVYTLGEAIKQITSTTFDTIFVDEEWPLRDLDFVTEAAEAYGMGNCLMIVRKAETMH